MEVIRINFLDVVGLDQGEKYAMSQSPIKKKNYNIYYIL